MLMGGLLIHLTGGRIETHFHVFGSLAFLTFYRDWRVLVPATIVVALDHLLRGIFWPQSVYGVLVASQWRWLEHAAWVIFEDIFLVVSCLRSVAEMRQRADRTAALEQEVRTRQEAEIDARNTAALAGAVGLALTHDAELDVMLQKCADALVQPPRRRLRGHLDPRRGRADARAAWRPRAWTPTSTPRTAGYRSGASRSAPSPATASRA